MNKPGLNESQLRDLMEEVATTAVERAFVSMGISPNTPMEMQKDMQFVRELRGMNDMVKRITLRSVFGLLLTATMALIAMGIKYWVVKK